MQIVNKLTLGLLISLAILRETEASIEDHRDPYWRRRAQEALKNTHQAYHSEPEKVTNHFNMQVHRAIEGTNSTRRVLKNKKKGACAATNPIDKCWRCDKNWAKNRMKLADCALGFAHNVTGGKGGKIYVVTDPSDSDMVNPKVGTLRHAVIQKAPLWIVFKKQMTIRLNQELIMASDKTIDGRGTQITIENGAGFTLQFIRNVIIHSLRIRSIKGGNGGTIRDSVDHYGFRSKSDGDAINIYGSSNIWIDHISMSNCQDGLIDAIEGSTAITISNCHFTKHNDVMLFGASDSSKKDSMMQITLAFNHFGKGLTQRMPRVRWGFAHIVSNDYTHWLMYAIGGSMHPFILSQGNRFVAPNDNKAKEVTKRDNAGKGEWQKWNWKSENDLMMNGAFFVQSGDPKYKFPGALIPPSPGSLAGKLTSDADMVLGLLPDRENESELERMLRVEILN
ncbi:hypothetical protein Leryth_022448 [Lithospermum erythrorhizon]|uniref:Pectate lyase n=1 Tax=Lithospermum erythrorhizon TaxID=34254 RepID=A0AAV3PCR7_LITER|nr:hypothetical protein Leryth_022448 [Lithospermum erythrorhizon]